MTRPSSGGVARSLLRMGPHQGAHRAAVRSALAWGAPLLIVAVSGHQELTPYAVLGAFTSLYARHEPRAARLKIQLTVALAQTSAVAVGAVVGVLAPASVAALAIVVVASALAALVSRGLRWQPAGSTFVVFAVATCSWRPGTWEGAAAAVIVCAAVASVCVAFGQLRPWPWRPAHRSSTRVRTVAVGALTGEGTPGMAGSSLPEVLRWSLAPAIAGLAAMVLPVVQAPPAMIIFVVAMSGVGTGHQLERVVHRVAGTLVGLLVAGVLLASTPSPVQVALLVAVLIFWIEAFIARHYALAVAGITPLALLVTDEISPRPVLATLTERAAETAVGLAATCVVLALVHAATGERGVGATADGEEHGLQSTNRPPTDVSKDKSG